MMTPPTIEVASLGMWDTLILMLMALVVFGPRRLPEIGRQIGKLMYEVRKASNDFKFQMEEELRKAEEADRRKKEELRVLAATPAVNGQDSQVPESGPPPHRRRPVDGDPGPGAPTGAVETVSQPSESRYGAPGMDEYPYPYEAVDPPVIAAPAETPAEEPYPHIPPPSTGNPVEAARPGNPVEAARAAEPIPVQEQAHHG